MLSRLPRLRNAASLLLLAVLISACGDSGTATPARTLPRATTTAPANSNDTTGTGDAAGVTTSTTEIALAVTPIPVPDLTSPLPPVLQEATMGGASQPALAAVATLGAPDWVKVGSRVTYYIASASVANASYAWVEDPNGPWEDPATGKHYRRTDESGEGMGDGAGDGYSQYDILGIEGSNVVVSNSIISIDHLDQQYIPAGGMGAKVAGASIDNLWIHPTQLAQIAAAQYDDMMVLRGDYPLNGKTYDAIMFASKKPGVYWSLTYDTVTGLLISSNTNTQGATTVGGVPGNSQLSLVQLVGVRQRNIPGLNGTNPSWVANTTKLNYTGLYNFTNPMDPSSANYTFPATSNVTLSKGGRNWESYSAQTTIQMMGSPVTASGVTGTAGTYWFDVSALKAMRARQVLDSEPITGETVKVQSITTQQGRKVVNISDQMAGFDGLYSYDQTSGALISYQIKIASSGATYQFQLQQRP
ncbi:MAG TPA: hypothetical protein VLQ48_14160 [Chloroflexia bacterium]|nr:hypothetical protein [Chloroflexia bacterium]